MLTSWNGAANNVVVYLTCLACQGSRPQLLTSRRVSQKPLSRVDGNQLLSERCLLHESVLVPMNRLWKILQTIFTGLVEVILHMFPFHAAAWHASAKSIDSILNDDDTATKESSTILWRGSTQSQLPVIAITVQYLGGFHSMHSAEQIHLPPRQP